MLLKKYLVYSVHQYNVRVCVCVFYFLPLKQCYTKRNFVHVKVEETTWKGHGEDETCEAVLSPKFFQMQTSKFLQ